MGSGYLIFVIDIFPALIVIIREIKYWKKIKIPEILIESKKAVDSEIRKILEKKTSWFFKILIKILNEMYVQSIQANKKGISFGL